MRTPRETKIPGFPKLPADASPAMRRYLESVAEALEIRLGRRGDSRDRAITARELIDSGLAVEGKPSILGQSESSLLPIGTDVNQTDLPTAPTGFAATGAYSVVILDWDQAYLQYSPHAYTEVWRHTADQLANAILVGVEHGSVFTDQVGSNKSYYYWIRHVNTRDKKGPWNSSGGTLGQTAVDVTFMLDLLTGEITESQLYSTLNSRINLIEVTENAVNVLESTVNDPATGLLATRATIFSDYYTQANTDSAIASATSTLVATSYLTNNYPTTVAVQQNYFAKVDGESLEGQYTVKIGTVNNTNYVAGFGLATTSSVAGGTTSQFLVAADRFAVVGPNGTGLVPFTVQTTTTNINGVQQLPGVYITDAYIKNGTITNLKIGDLAVDAAKIALLAVDTAQINNSAVDTGKIRDLAVETAKIDNEAVTNAKIENLAVTTLKIAGENVTVPRAVSGGSGASLSSSWTQIGSITVNWGSVASLLPSQVQFFGQLNIIATQTGSNEVTRGLRISSGSQDGIVGQSSLQGFSDCMSAGFVHTPSTGSTTYRIYGSSTGSGATAGNWFISLLGVKR